MWWVYLGGLLIMWGIVTTAVYQVQPRITKVFDELFAVGVGFIAAIFWPLTMIRVLVDLFSTPPPES